MNSSPRISLIHFFILCFVSAFGLPNLPRSIAQIAQKDMWLSMIVAGVFFLFTVWIIAKLAAYFPEHTCIEYHQILLGPVLGQILNILLVIICMMIIFIQLRTFTIAAKMFLFSVTPPEVVVLALLLLLLYAAQYGLLPIIRMQQVIFASSYVVVLGIILLGLLAVKIENYQPMLAEGFTPVLKGAIPAWAVYTGPGIVIGLLYPFITRQRKVLKWGISAVIALIAIYTLFTAIVQGILGTEIISQTLIPAVIAYRNVEIPDTFIERIDGYFLIFWIPILVASMLNWLYFAAFGVERMLKLEYSRPVVVLLIPLLFYLIDFPPDFQTYEKISEVVNIALIAWDLGIWPLLLVIAWQREKRRMAC